MRHAITGRGSGYSAEISPVSLTRPGPRSFCNRYLVNSCLWSIKMVMNILEQIHIQKSHIYNEFEFVPWKSSGTTSNRCQWTYFHIYLQFFLKKKILSRFIVYLEDIKYKISESQQSLKEFKSLPPKFQTQPSESNKKGDPIPPEAYLSFPADKTLIKSGITNCRYSFNKSTQSKRVCQLFFLHLERWTPLNFNLILLT